MSQFWLRAAEIRHLHKQGHKDCAHGHASCMPSPRRALYGMLSALSPTTALPGGIFAPIKQIRRQGSKRRGGGQGHEGYKVAVPGSHPGPPGQSPPRFARVISRPCVLKHTVWKVELLPGKEQGWTHLASSIRATRRGRSPAQWGEPTGRRPRLLCVPREASEVRPGEPRVSAPRTLIANQQDTELC